MGEAVEAAYRPTADDAKTKSPGRPKKGGGTSPTRSKQDESTRTTSVAAAAVGMDRRTYEKAKEVIASKDAKLVAVMNKSGKAAALLAYARQTNDHELETRRPRSRPVRHDVSGKSAGSWKKQNRLVEKAKWFSLLAGVPKPKL